MNEPEFDLATIESDAVEPALKEPALYIVLLHNDDFTPMEFVVEILQTIFHLSLAAARTIMLDVHHKGLGRCGIYPYDVAQTKVSLVRQAAHEREYPLRASVEKAID